MFELTANHTITNDIWGYFAKTNRTFASSSFNATCRRFYSICMSAKREQVIAAAIEQGVNENFNLMGKVAKNWIENQNKNENSKAKEIASCIKLATDLSISPSKQNKLIVNLILEIKQHTTAKLFPGLFTEIYQNPLLSPAHHLHLLSLTQSENPKKEAPLACVREIARSFNRKREDSSGSLNGFYLKNQELFSSTLIHRQFYAFLDINDQNQFLEREIVAVNSKGTLLHNSHAPHYGIVTRITITEKGDTQYTISLKLSKENVCSEFMVADAGMLGKIERNDTNHAILSKLFPIS